MSLYSDVEDEVKIFQRIKNIVLSESPTLRLFKAIERGNIEGVNQALEDGGLVSPSEDERLNLILLYIINLLYIIIILALKIVTKTAIMAETTIVARNKIVARF